VKSVWDYKELSVTDIFDFIQFKFFFTLNSANMRSILIVVIACVSLGLISAAISPSVIEADLNEINGLSHQIKSLTPTVMQSFGQTFCKVITECCPEAQATFAQSILQGKGQTVFEQCFGGKGSPQAMQKIQSCKPMSQIRSLTQDPQFQKLSKLGSKIGQNSQNKALIASNCSPDELQAIACGTNNVQLESACQRKVLQRIAQDGDSTYQSRVQEVKTTLQQSLGEIRNTL